MGKRTLSLLTGILLLVLVISPCHAAEKNLDFNSKDPKIKDINTVNGMLDAWITKNDRGSIEKLMAYTKDRGSMYALLIMSEFYEDLSLGKLETMRQGSPERWNVFQSYLNKALAWLALTRKADNFLGGHLESTLKEKLGENEK